jgi:SNF2 family DNA or RNA helicase
MPQTLLPEPGQIVSVRQRPFVVLDCVASAVAESPSARQHLVRLSSVEDEGLGEELNVIWELEPGAAAHQRTQLPEPDGFDLPERFDAFLNAVAWGSVSQADDKTLQSPFRSGIEVDDYQLDPVVRALSMPRVNLLIADDVGLGKTIETGLVAQELILRHRVRTIHIVCPSSIQIQWRDEMRDKFGLDFRIVDTDLLRELRRRRGLHVNPWTHFPRLITSIDFLKRERPLRSFREILPASGDHAYPRRFDLLIVDEAHNIAPSGRGKYATDSQRTAAIRTLAPHFEHKLFLSATPHNGYRESFTALLELIDNQRFHRGIDPHRAQLDAIMVRRLKSELELRWDGSRRFAKRVVNHIEVPYTEAERAAHRALQDYSESRQKSAGSGGDRMATEFVLKLLKKRLFSSPAAFQTTLQKHAASVGLSASDQSTSWKKQVEEAEEDFANDEEYEQAALEALEAASRHSHALSADEKRLLSQLRTYADAAASRADSKATALLDWLDGHLKSGRKWNNNRVIIFTEYRATQKWLHDLLASRDLAADGRLLMLYGGMQLEDREKVKAAFQTHPDQAPVRILLATDSASEGINLQNHCSHLIHYEIPWNPTRMEQRNGRVDRHGQKAAEVRIFHFVGQGFDAAKPGTAPSQLEADLEFLARAAIKVETIREDLGKVGPVIADQVEEAMLGHRRTLDTSRAEKDSEPIRKLLKFERQLRTQLEKLVAQLHGSQRELHLTPQNVLSAVQVALELAGQPPLQPAAGIPGAFHLPAMRGSWGQCAQGLAHPHTGTIRPLVFDANLAVGRDDVVLCHLGHRLVQMSLRLLRAEVWSQGQTKKLHRFTARMIPDHVLPGPAVVAHGRLIVIGGDHHRLHEEILLAGGVIKEGRFSRLGVNETRTAWDAALPEAVPAFIEDALRNLWSKLSGPLLQSLEARMSDRTKNLQNTLDERADKECTHLATIMDELKRSIEGVLKEVSHPQTEFDFVKELSGLERNQRQRDIEALRARLASIPDELTREQENLRRRYASPQPRLFPLAVTFLIPASAVAQLRGGRQ